MNVFSKRLIVSIVATLMSSMSSAASVVQQNTFEDPVDYALNTGYFVPRSLLDDTFYQYNITQRSFNALKMESPYVVTTPMMDRFEPIVYSLENYINEHKKGIMSHCEDNPQKCSTTFQSINGVSERELAIEITRASYCFGTDPFVVTSKIRQESRFDMTSVSNTGAIGLTQLTAPGLEEVLDQLGHRGPKYAFMDNKEVLIATTKCYMHADISDVLKDFPEIKLVTLKSGGVAYTPDTIANIKSWVLPRKNSSGVFIKDKKKLIQRQLFLGQILLKIYLAYSKKVLKNQSMAKQYEAALRMFNGDDIRVKYAKEVIKYSKQAESL